MKITVIDRNESSVKEYAEKILLADAVREMGYTIDMPCNAKGICGKCLIRASGAISQKSEQEAGLLPEDDDFRLACLTYALGDVEVNLTPLAETKVLTDGILPEFNKKPIANNYGFAVDIGTTTVASYLYDLGRSEVISKRSFKNPQRIFGADVISRIEEALENSADKLSELIVSELEQDFSEMCEEVKIDKSDVEVAVIAGNTTMMYLMLKEDVKPLSAAPFEINRFLGETIKSDELSFKGFDNCKVYIPKTISAFVGVDITAAILSSRIDDKEKPCILVDIGTNGEMALNHNGKLFCCSTAAGPAFEGAGITMGSAAVAGAVNKVSLIGNKIKYTTIDNQVATGICGSGIIDMLAVIVKANLVDETGLIDEENTEYSEYICEYNGETAIRVGDSEVYVTQQDIRELQLSKSAICAGIYSLINAANIECEDVETLYLAGGFGSFINIESAACIGLVPGELRDKSQALGNAAAMGAIMILLSESECKKSTQIAEKAEVLDLSTSSYFMNKYVECMMF